MTPVPTLLATVMTVPPAPAAASGCPDLAHRVVIDVERPGEVPAREALLDRAFGPGRFGKTCERLRAHRLPAQGLSLVAGVRESGGAAAGRTVVGTVRLWHVAAGERGGHPVPALMLGPLAVEDAWRCHRLGARLMEAAIERARAAGHGAILLVGDEPYYRRFGFTRLEGLAGGLAEGLSMPGPVDPGRFLVLELRPGALAGARGMVRATGALELAGHRSRRPRRSPHSRGPHSRGPRSRAA